MALILLPSWPRSSVRAPELCILKRFRRPMCNAKSHRADCRVRLQRTRSDNVTLLVVIARSRRRAITAILPSQPKPPTLQSYGCAALFPPSVAEMAASPFGRLATTTLHSFCHCQACPERTEAMKQSRSHPSTRSGHHCIAQSSVSPRVHCLRTQAGCQMAGVILPGAC